MFGKKKDAAPIKSLARVGPIVPSVPVFFGSAPEGYVLIEQKGVVITNVTASDPFSGSFAALMREEQGNMVRALSSQTKELGCNAVLNCQLEYGTYQRQGSSWNGILATMYGNACVLERRLVRAAVGPFWDCPKGIFAGGHWFGNWVMTSLFFIHT
ncbi:hypothetical protein [Kordiimonas marina]|uniref:hypothetical protein n=1 Tax=Kordiimonas marina TaxID=2872312 RepID=UPI001FF184CF|nr:hypothetical protein [Kordiimonas marina]MCJ9428070.1 hypothetical protein [Kordiimonas marina]